MLTFLFRVAYVAHSTDDPIGRVEIDLASVGRDQISNKWYELGWIPGQVFPAPRGEVCCPCTIAVPAYR